MEEAHFRYHLELTPEQLKLTHTALRSLLDDFGHDEPQIRGIIQEVLAKLPDEHAIRAIRLESPDATVLELDSQRTDAAEPTPGGDDPSAA